MFDTPILFIIFKRSDTALKVLEQIKKVRPKQLFIAADGPRSEKEEEKELCNQTRALVLKNIDWPCEVKTLFQETNLGCGIGPCSAINWFFEHVEQGIILEDDCIPDTTFFNYCKLLLDRYKDNNQILSISGDNFQDGIKRGDGSYYFSNIFHGWGWATWKRAWQLNDFYMKEWPNFSEDRLLKICNNDKVRYDYWYTILDSVYKKTINADPWDYQFLFSIWLHNGINIHPNLNLVSNIGFGEGATHTTESDHVMANKKAYSYKVDKIPSEISINNHADTYTFYNSYISVNTSSKKQKKYTLRDKFYLFRQDFKHRIAQFLNLKKQ